MQASNNIQQVLMALHSGKISVEEASAKLRLAPYQELFEGVNIDQQRRQRTGLGETVLAEGKSFERLLAAIKALAATDNAGAADCQQKKHCSSNMQSTPEQGRGAVLATRVSEEQGHKLLEALDKEGVNCAEFWPEAKLFSCNKNLGLTPPWPKQFNGDKRIIIVTAGAADLPVALEALGTARFYGLDPVLAPDLGVAGLHRLQPWLELLHQAELVIAVAGMDGALPSVLAGLCRCPVLGVPTAVGYGVAAGGYSALLNMLSGCAPGLAVMNIANGYGAAMFAAKLFLSRAEQSAVLSVNKTIS